MRRITTRIWSTNSDAERCTSGACTGQTSPSFWTTARLSTIATETRTAGAYKTADLFTLTQSFPDPGDSQAAALWLDTIQRTGIPGATQIVEAPTTFLKTPLQNRVWVVDGLAPLDKFRISSISLPAGARISVNYSAQECTPAMAPGILAAPWNNTKRCFPVWWTPDLEIASAARQDLFHKYVVTSMIEDPYTGGGGSPTIRTNYEYTGTPGWRYADDRLIPADRRSWNEYAGYDKVEVRVGDPATPAQQETTQYLFYRGLNGDRANASGGTKSVMVTGTSVPDDLWFAGSPRSVKTLDGVGGAVVSETVSTPVWSALTLGYDPGTRQLTSLDETTRRNGTVFTREALREYTRNAAGIITRASTTADGQAADVQCYQYDALQALKEAWTPASGDCGTGPTAARGGPAPYRASYQVNPVTGNRLQAVTWAGSTATTATYSYPTGGAARPHAVTQISSTSGSGQPAVTSYAHDAAGAMTNRGSHTLTYDQSGRIASVVAGSSTEKSLYTADGALLMRWGGTDGASLFIGDTILRNKAGVTSGVRSYSVAGISVAERVSGTGGGLWWLSPDPVGTVSLQINSGTGAVSRRWMDPFGGNRGGVSTWSSQLGFLNAPSSSTGLTQLGARAYDPALGRFVSVDPLLDVNEPRHTNAYTYAYHSPVSFSDPTGLRPLGTYDRADSPRAQPKAAAKSATSAPAAAGKPAASSPKPKPKAKQEVQWWNPATWDKDAWITAGSIAVGVVATVAIGACVVATAGICGAVGVGIGLVATATVGAATSVASYQMTSGPKTAEGGMLAQFSGAAGGAVGGALSVVAKPAVVAASGAVSKALSSSGGSAKAAAAAVPPPAAAASPAIAPAAATAKVSVVNFSRSRAPGIAQNFDNAVAGGAPTQLTRVSAQVRDRNRAAALRGQPPAGAGRSLDEYPFASSAEGGSGSYVSAVPIGEQHYQGGVLSSFYKNNNVAPGDRFGVSFGP